ADATPPSPPRPPPLPPSPSTPPPPILSANLVPRTRTAEHRGPSPFCDRPAHQTLDFSAVLHSNAYHLPASEFGGQLNARLTAAEIFLKANCEQSGFVEVLFDAHFGHAVD